MIFKSNPYHEVRIYIGSREGYEGPLLTRDDLRNHIGKFQAESGENTNPVRLTETAYIFKDYEEYGWEIATIQYPRFPKPVQAINRFALDLAESLLNRFKQNRISVIFPDEIIMLEADNAQQGRRTDATNKESRGPITVS